MHSLLAHEVAFGGFLLLTTLRLAVAAGPFDLRTLVFAGMLAAEAACILPSLRRDSRPAWALRLAYFPVAANVAYFALGPAMAALQPAKADAFLMRIDEVLVGGSLSLRLEPLAGPAFTEIMTFCYALFLPYLYLSLIHHARRDLETAKKLFAGVFTIYGIGFLGYTLLF